MPSQKLICLCFECTSSNPNGRLVHRKTAIRHIAAAKVHIASLYGTSTFSSKMIEDLNWGMERTYQNIMAFEEQIQDDFSWPDPVEDISISHKDQTFNNVELQIPPNLEDNSGVPMDLELEYSNENDSDSQLIASAKRELPWDPEGSDLESDFNGLDNIEIEDKNNIPAEQPQSDNDNDDDNFDINEEESKFSTPALQELKKELLGDYKPPSEPPIEPFNLPILDEAQKLSLKHYSAWQKSNGTVKAYNAHASVLAEATGIEILSLYMVESLAESITNLHPRNIDMCPKSCIAYTGKYSQLQKCEYISSATKERCNLPRYTQNSRRRQPAAQYTVLPIKATIDALYANVQTSKLMRHRDNCKKSVLNLLGTAANQRTYSDFGDSFIHTNVHQINGLFQNPQDVAFALSTDGAQLTMKKQSNTWILILIILNLPPEIRYKSENVIINFATPGPNSPGDIESFIRPLFEEMAQGSEGIWIWDALESAHFLIKACIAIGAGDMLGSAKINGMAGHAAIYGDRFSTVQAAKSSTARGSKAQYYPILTTDKYNPSRPQYSYNSLPLREHEAYFKTLRKLELAGNENQRRNITKASGVSRLPLCAASPAFFHPTFFPLDPFHLIYENCMAFIWDLWTIESTEGEIMHISTDKAATLGKLVADAMETLPPSFCGPVRNPYLKRQSQYKVFEWMALLHWYLIPMGLELNFNSLILQNFSHFVQAMDYSMTNKPRSEDDLSNLQALITLFLTDFERLYIGNNPDRNNRARLCIFQLIHIPLHIKWNGSIRIGSQATVERSIGEMGHKVRSKKSPFANLTNLIVRRERIKLLGLYYPELFLGSKETLIQNPALSPTSQLFQKVHIRVLDCQPGADAFSHIVQILGILKLSNPDHVHALDLDDFQRYGKLRLPNHRVLHSELAYSLLQKAPARKSYWFSSITETRSVPLFGLALAFYNVKIMDNTHTFVIYKKLIDVEEVLGVFRGKYWSTETYVIGIDKISDIVGIWSHKAHIYILQKHPGLDMLDAEESGRESDDAEALE